MQHTGATPIPIKFRNGVRKKKTRTLTCKDNKGDVDEVTFGRPHFGELGCSGDKDCMLQAEKGLTEGQKDLEDKLPPPGLAMLKKLTEEPL